MTIGYGILPNIPLFIYSIGKFWKYVWNSFLVYVGELKIAIRLSGNQIFVFF